jgi:Xaa-Pro aminopeptidase
VAENHLKLQKTTARIQEKQLGGLVIYSGGTCSILRPSYLHYFTGFKPMGSRNAAVVSKSGEVVLLVEPFWDEDRASRESWITEVRGSENFMGDLRSVLEKMGISGPVGVVGSREMTSDVYAALEALTEIQPADDILEQIARVKSKREIAVVQKVAALSDIGFNAFLKYAREGIREYELAGQMEFAMRSAGAQDIFILLSSGANNFEMHDPTDRRLERGDILIGEITPVLEGQFFQLCRTLVLGEASALLEEKYALLMQALEKTLAEVRAGVPASVISKTMNRIFSDAGYEKYCYPPYMRARGHGFGAGSLAPGGLIDDNTEADLVKDQVVVIHPNQWLPETGYLACGGTFLITENGYLEPSWTETRLYIKEG